MINQLKTLGPSERMLWFDCNRAMAAFGVLLIHSSTDASGQAFAKADAGERLVPVLIRSISELSGSEMFFVFSLFLLAFKLDRRMPDYGHTIKDQAKRLLVPFAFWTVFYAFFRLCKASAFGYAPAIATQLTDWHSWADYFLLGTAQYQLHFLPTLFLIVFFYPVMKVATRYPAMGLAVFGMLGAMDYVQGSIWGSGVDPFLRDYLVRATKVLGYVGYGFAAFAIYGFWKQGVPRGESRLLRRAAIFLAAFAFVTTLPLALQAINTGQFPVRTGWGFYGHFLMPLFVFTAFMGGQYADWSPKWSKLAKFTFGIYLVHPILIDMYDIAVYTFGVHTSPTVMVITKFALVAPASFGLAYLISRWSLTAWTIGLGPLPWISKPTKPAHRIGAVGH